MKKKIFFSIIFFCVMFVYSYAQQGTTSQLKISYQKNLTNDTIWLTVTNPIYQKPGTLLVTAYQTTVAETDSFYFPVIDTINYYGIVIPANLQQGKLKLHAFFYPKIFEVSGMVLNKTKSEIIDAILITKNEKIYNKTLKLSDDKQFTLPGLIFENKASLIFNYTSANKKEKPNIVINQSPALSDFKDTAFTAAIILQEDKPAVTDTSKQIQTGKTDIVKDNKKSVLMGEVIVTGIKKSKAEKYNEEFSTGLFNDASERVIDCLSNNNILSYPDCLSFLTSQVPGLTVQNDRFGGSGLYWRGKETKAFYIDEIEVDIDQIQNINVADIAIVKAYPPPFFGASTGNGDGGAIAIYTRVGDYKRENATNNKWLFSIKGYSPAIHVLDFEHN